MRISPISTYSNMNFKGYDARRLKSIAVTEVGAQYEIAKQLDAVAQKNGFELQILNDDELRPLSYCFEESKKQQEVPKGYIKVSMIKSPKDFKVVVSKSNKEEKKLNGFHSSDKAIKWAQDIATVTPNKNVLTNNTWDALGRKIAEKYNYTPQYCVYRHIAGGNLFFIKNGNSEELLVGMDEKGKFKKQVSKMQEAFGVNKISYIPQMDYHLDMFIRPLDNKRILVANDEMTLKNFEDGLEIYKDAIQGVDNKKEYLKLASVIEQLKIQKNAFSRSIRINDRPSYDDISKVLIKNGYEPIPVPARVYYSKDEDLVNTQNYTNAIVAINDKDELVYITNKSKLDSDLGITKEMEEKYGFSMEKCFIDSLSKYIKSENIYFISGHGNSIADDLEKLYGGIHCQICEIPED